jgi:5-methylthioadenosine/S-adenosylhomocysteine deaminase
MVMGGEIYMPFYEEAWKIGRELDMPIALHVVGTFGMTPTFDGLAEKGQVRPRQHLHPHDRHDRHGLEGRGRCRRACVAVGADRDAHAPRRAADPEGARLGMSPSLSSDVECTMSADPSPRCAALITLAAHAHQRKALAGEDSPR